MCAHGGTVPKFLLVISATSSLVVTSGLGTDGDLVRLFTLIVLFSLKPPEATVAKYQHLLKFQLVSHVEVCFFCIYLCVNYFIIIVKIIGFYYLVHTIF